MPVDRPLAADLAENLVTLYQDAETRLAGDLARRLASGMDSPTWAEDKLRGLTTLRRFSENLVGRLDGTMAEEVAQATILAYVRGGNAAMDDLGRAQSTHPEWLRAAGINNPNDRLRAMIDRRQAGVAAQLAQARRALPGADAVARLAFNLTTRLQGAHLRIARWDLDSYREVVAAGSAPDVLLGLSTRRRASQVAWEKLLSHGITGFIDKSGRGWNLASYVEMATRSTVAQAAVEGHLDRLGAAGLDLVIVSNAPQECEKCRPWEGKILARKGPDGKRTVQVEHGTRDGQLVDVDVAGSVDQAVSAGLMHPNCFPAEVLVSAPSGVVAADARWYEGPLVVIHTASGDELPVTPNHPVLTPEGWVPAGLLQVGQSVLRYRSDVEQPALGAPDDQQVPARISEVFDALRESSTVPAVRVPVAPEQFHGDGFGSDVDVVLADGQLGLGPRQQGGEGQLLGGGVRAGSLLAGRPPLQVTDGAGHAAHGLMGGRHLGSALLCRHGRPLAGLGLAAGDARTALLDPAADAGLGDAESGRQLVLALTGLVEADQVIDLVLRESAALHVYNLQTGGGWYVANSLVVSNCRHSLSAYLPGVTRVPTNTEDPEGDKARQQLRALERKVRSEKLKAETAIDPAAKAGHEAKVRAAQGQIREHVKATGLHRQPGREQIDLGHRPPPGPTATPAPPPPPPPAPAPAPAPPAPAPTPTPKPVVKKVTPAKAVKKAAKKPVKSAPPPPTKAAKAAPAKKATQAKPPAKKTVPRKTAPPPPPKKTALVTPTPPPTPTPAPAVASLAEVPRTARPFHRNLTGIEDLANAVENGRPERARRSLTGGVSAETELVTLRDGTRVVYKYGGNPSAEQGASLIARALGLDAPRVYRNHSSSVYMDFVDNAESGAEVAVRRAQAANTGDRQTQWRGQAYASDDGRRIGLLDLMIANGDRNVGNWMLPRDSPRVVPIDHGHAFPSALMSAGRRMRARPNPGSPFAEHYHNGQTWQPNHLTPADIIEVRRRLDGLRPDFEHLGQPQWIEYALVVLDALEPHAAGTRNLIAGVG